MIIVELKKISKEYRNDMVVTKALTDIDLSIEQGEFVAIMGASGSGKTTLLNILGCMDAPTEGTYLFNGKDLTAKKESQLCNIRGKKISFVFQHFALIDEYTVFENVELPLMKRGISKSSRKKLVLNALKKVGISELAKKRPTHISGGQKQRTAIARSIVGEPDIILADEPTGALDHNTGTEIMQLFSSLNKEGTTIILITHDEAVSHYADRLIYIEDGRIVKDEKK